MDSTLDTILAALEGLDAPTVADRVNALDALTEALPQLAGLSSEQWDVKLASVEDDVEELGEAADRASARFEQARRALETLRRFAERHGAVIVQPADQSSLGGDVGRNDDAADRNGRRENAIAQAETTREAILQVMARRPHREWTAVAITDDLARYSRPVARSNVQVTLRRLAVDGRVRKVGRGTYQIRSDNPAGITSQEALPDDLARARKEVRHQAALKAAETKRRQKEAAALSPKDRAAQSPEGTG